nr:major facilitator superfamily domain, general substrate transporter [Tanacetum cinerariifolium]
MYYGKAVRRSGRNKDKVVFDSDISKLVESTSKESTTRRRPGKYKGLRRSRRNKDQEVYDSDNVKTVASGSKESLFGGMVEFKVDEIPLKLGLYVVDNFDEKKMEIKLSKGSIVLTKDMIGDMLGIKNEGVDILEGNPNRDDEMLKRNQKACLEEIGFGGMVDIKVDGIPSKLGLYVVDNFDEKKMEIKLSKGSIVLTKDMIGDMFGIKNEGVDILEGNPNRDDEMMCYVDGTKYNDNIVCRRRPPTKVWMAKLLSQREAIEMNCGGLKCSSEGNNSSTNAMMPYIQEKEKDVQGEAGYPNMNRDEVLNEEVEVLDGDIGVNEQTPSSRKDLMGLNKKCVGQDADVGQDVDVGQDACSLFGFDSQENMCGLLTQKAFESIEDEVELSIEKSKSMEVDDRPSFSFDVTQDFNVIEVTKNENKVLTPITNILFKSKSGQQSNRLQTESLGQDYVETNIQETWAMVCNFMEDYRSNESPFRLFLPTFVVDNDRFSQE